MVYELAKTWFNVYYETVLNCDWDDGVPLRGAIQPSEEHLEHITAQAKERAEQNLAYANSVLKVAYPDLKHEWRELMSVIMSAVDRRYYLKASKEQLLANSGLDAVEFAEAFSLFELWKLTEPILYGQGVRAEDVGKFYVPLAYALKMFPKPSVD